MGCCSLERPVLALAALAPVGFVLALRGHSCGEGDGSVPCGMLGVFCSRQPGSAGRSCKVGQRLLSAPFHAAMLSRPAVASEALLQFQAQKELGVCFFFLVCTCIHMKPC